MRKWQVTTGPASEPLTASEVKTYLKVDTTADDDLIGVMITAARQSVERYLQMGLLPQTITEKFDYWHEAAIGGDSSKLFLSVSPLRSVTSIQYKDTAGSTQTFSSANYIVDDYSSPPRIGLGYGKTWPTLYGDINDITITYTVGYDDSDSIPEPIQAAMKLIIADLYDNRTDRVKKMPTAAEYLLNQYRVFVF